MKERIKNVFPFVFLFLISCNAREYFLVTGTYTNTGSEGIYVHRFETASAAATIVDSVKSSNPSFLVFSKNADHLYAVNEDGKGNGAVSSYAFSNKTGRISFLNKQPSFGDHPCHITLDETGRWLMLANYSSGTVAAYAVQPNGDIDTPYQKIQLTGKSKHPQRQQSAHAHQVLFSPNNKFLYVTDLGSDKIMVYSFDQNTGGLKPASPAFVNMAAGGGPRHMIFSPSGNFAYLIEELTGTLVTLTFDENTGGLEPTASVSTVPKYFTGYAGSAEIVLSKDGKYLYASNRGTSNTIAVFDMMPVVGWPFMKQIDSSQGKAPRHISLHPSGRYLLVANMDSDEIVVFDRSKRSGRIQDSGKRIPIRKPVCMQWVKIKK